MSAFHEAVQDFIEAIKLDHHGEVGTHAQSVLDQIQGLEGSQASWGLMSFVRLLADPECPYHAVTACLCEALMQQGGDPWLVTGLIVERLRDTLAEAVEFEQILGQRCAAAGSDPRMERKNRGLVWKQLAQERALQAYRASTLDLFCLPAVPILGHFPQARQLFRAGADAVEQLRLFVHLDPVRDLLEVLEANAAEPGEPPAAGVERALAKLSEAMGRGAEAEKEVSACLREVYQAVFCVGLPTRNQALGSLGELIRRGDPGYLGALGQLAGSIVEAGG